MSERKEERKRNNPSSLDNDRESESTYYNAALCPEEVSSKNALLKKSLSFTVIVESQII
jgi:hypothetical protein